MMRVGVAALAVLGLVGCSTPYQTMGFSGGVEAQQMTANTFRIVARGNGFTNAITIQDYVALKAAETTRQAGGTHFMVISASDASSAGYVSTPGHMQTSVIGNTAYSTYNPGSTYQILKPGQDAYIRVINVPAGQNPPGGAMSADEVIQFVGARIKQG
jgi:hypothetical protein